MSPLQAIYWKVRRLFGDTPAKANHRFHRRRSPQLISEYLATHKVKKLQIGAEAQIISGWLNADILPKSRDVVWMDATKPFPFPDNTFDFIYSEHMIEHIGYHEGTFMLKECFRVLKAGGKIRISTPNLAFLIQLYQYPEKETHKRYITFSQRYFSDKVPEYAGFVVNNFFRDWGHQYIYDTHSLAQQLEQAGFTHIKEKEVGESSYHELADLERHGNEITDEFNRLESLIIEGEK